jgi:hypothetical protein
MKKEDINFVFEENPDLITIGTKEQYEKYLETIFPESKVKDIVYHRGPEKIERFYRSKIKNRNGKRFYFSPFNTYRYGQQVTQALLNIKNLAIPYDDNFLDEVNKKHPEYTEGKSKWFHLPAQIYVDADKYGYDGVADLDGSSNDEYSVYSPDQIHVLGSKKDIKCFKKHVQKSKGTLENKVISGIFGLMFLSSLFLISSNITGSFIGNINKAGSSLLGIILFLSSISGFFAYRKLRS